MRRLNRLALRNLWTRKLRTLVTGFGIVLGVATVLAFGIANATVENSLGDFFSQTAGDADLTVTRSTRDATFRVRVLNQLAGAEGVALAAGSLWRGGDLRLADEDQGITLVGIDPEIDAQVRSYKLAEGRMVGEGDRVYSLVLVSQFAADHDIQLGDDVQISLDGGRLETFEVIGLLENEGAARFNNGAVGFLRLDTAQDLFDERGRLSQVDLVLAPGIATEGDRLEAFKDALGDALGEDYTVAYPSALGEAFVDSLAGLRTGLSIFSTIALFVGGMLIYNTFAMTVAERVAEIGMLRALGATRGQVLRLVLIEAVLMGLLGSISGLGLGLFLAIPVIQLFARGFGGIPLERFTVPPGSVVMSVLVGVLVTGLAALVPAWQAGRISPVEAMRVRAGTRAGFLGRNGWMIGLALLGFALGDSLLDAAAAVVASLALAPAAAEAPGFRSALSAALTVAGLALMAPRFWMRALELPARRWQGLMERLAPWTRNRAFGVMAEGGWAAGLPLVMQGLAVLTPLPDYLPAASFFMLLFTGGTLVLPATIRALERGARRLLEAVYGPPGGLGSRNLNRARGRTSLTVGVLMVGATMIIAIGSLQTAFDSALGEWVDTAMGGDLMVSAERGQRVQFVNQLMSIPGVEMATPYSISDVEMTAVTDGTGRSAETLTLGFQAIDLPSYRSVAGFQFAEEAEREEETLARLAQGDAVLISTVLSGKYDLHRGDAIYLRTRQGERAFEVAGVTNNFMWGGNSVIGTWADGERYLGVTRAWLFLVKLAPGAEADEVRPAIEGRLARDGDFDVQSAVQFRETISRDAGSFMAVFNLVVYIAVLVAGLGVVNTMTMNILERVREIGMLRAVGMTRAQLGRMVLAEAAAMGAIGGAFGLAIGWLISQDMVGGMSEGSGWQFKYIFPAAAFLSAAVTTLVIAQLAALYPVWRAGRLRVVEAIQHE
jgi:ABC-type antimicrobial peptide transport system permease subunit